MIQGLKVETLIGVYDWERERTTELIVDITIHANLQKAMESDDVHDTIDYAAVADAVKDVGKQSQFELLEALGNAILDTLLQRFPIARVAVEIEKPGILPDAQRVAVNMAKER